MRIRLNSEHCQSFFDALILVIPFPLHWQSYPSNMPNSDPQEGFAVPDEDDGMPPPPDEGY